MKSQSSKKPSRNESGEGAMPTSISNSQELTIQQIFDGLYARFEFDGVLDEQTTQEQLLQLALSCLPQKTSLEDLDPKEKINRVEYAKFFSIRNAAIDTIEQNMRAKFQ